MGKSGPFFWHQYCILILIQLNLIQPEVKKMLALLIILRNFYYNKLLSLFLYVLALKLRKPLGSFFGPFYTVCTFALGH